jgi:hypothetical protein
MRTASIRNGADSDRVNACAIALRHSIDRRSLQARAPAVLRCLEQLAGHSTSGPGLVEAVDWLKEVITTHPVLQEQQPGVGEIRRNLLDLARRIGAKPSRLAQETSAEAEDR